MIPPPGSLRQRKRGATVQRLQVWREANELEGRELMVGGQWLVLD